MKGYIYNVGSKEIVAIIGGEDNAVIEAKAVELGYMGTDEYALAYNDYGLIETKNTMPINAYIR